MLHLIANLQDRAFSVSNNKLFDKSSSIKPLLSWLTVEIAGGLYWPDIPLIVVENLSLMRIDIL